MITDRFDANLDARLYAGEPIMVELQLLDIAGAIEDLTGRRFLFTVFRSDRTSIVAVEGTIAAGADAHASFGIDGGETEQLLAATGLRYEAAELVDTGRNVIAAGRLIVSLSAPASEIVPADPAVAGGQVTRFVRELHANAPRIVVSQRGARGRSLTEELGTTPAEMLEELVTGPVAAAVGQVDVAITSLGEATENKFAEIDGRVDNKIEEIEATVAALDPPLVTESGGVAFLPLRSAIGATPDGTQYEMGSGGQPTLSEAQVQFAQFTTNPNAIFQRWIKFRSNKPLTWQLGTNRGDGIPGSPTFSLKTLFGQRLVSIAVYGSKDSDGTTTAFAHAGYLTWTAEADNNGGNEQPSFLHLRPGTAGGEIGSGNGLEINSKSQAAFPGPYRTQFFAGDDYGAILRIGPGSTTVPPFALTPAALTTVPVPGAVEIDAAGALHATNAAGDRKRLLDDVDRAAIVADAAAAGGPPTFVQPTQPDHPGPYTWWDTSGGNLTLWIEDGE